MMPVELPAQLRARIRTAHRVRLFLDYDGTLADFAPTPDIVAPDPEVEAIVRALAATPGLWVGIISGRQLDQITALVPVDGILRAGTYGVELLAASGELIHRAELDALRAVIDVLKDRWSATIGERQGFFLEDKTWSLALHARWASAGDAEQVLRAARTHARQVTAGKPLRTLGGHRFLEVGPAIAHKGQTITYLLDGQHSDDDLLMYFGDDDKDEEAFEVIKARNGIAVLVAAEPRPTVADFRLNSPTEARRWLASLPALRTT